MILQYDTVRRPGITQPALPKTSPPEAPSVAAAAAVERRTVPQGGLTMSVLRNYRDEEIDTELRHLGNNIQQISVDKQR